MTLCSVTRLTPKPGEKTRMSAAQEQAPGSCLPSPPGGGSFSEMDHQGDFSMSVGVALATHYPSPSQKQKKHEHTRNSENRLNSAESR